MMIVCVNIFLQRKNKVLMIKRSVQKIHAPGFIHPIGGKVEKGESPLQAVKRELIEESGLKAKNIHLKAVVVENSPYHKEEDWLIFHFTGDYTGGKTTKTDEGELLWIDKDKLTKQKLHPSLKKFIKSILEPTKEVIFISFDHTK